MEFGEKLFETLAPIDLGAVELDLPRGESTVAPLALEAAGPLDAGAVELRWVGATGTAQSAEA
ncbi:MAG: hypothetical protein M0027_00925 [Candidatus Dormibacteraeota bacterium]|jgi:hypothetical protein|nr:hypothetical protein [Candidatus Dormibacteraeota bacterium]